MRISTSLTQQQAINSILNQQAKLSKTQLQLGSGLRILKPSDDPSASVKVLDLQQSIEQTNQYKSNIDTVVSRLTLEDTTLSNFTDALQRARELTVQSLNGAIAGDDRKAIEQEVRQVLDQLVGLANTKNANGEYLFSGFKSQTPPYAPTVSQVTQGAITKDVTLFQYQGDDHQRDLQVGSIRRIADGDNGENVFGRSFDYLGNPPTTTEPANPTQGSIFDVVAKLAEGLSADTLDAPQITTFGAGMGVARSGSAIDSALLATAVADQTLTVTAPDGTTQTHVIDVDSERSAADIATQLNGFTGVSGRANPNQAIVDLGSTAAIADGDTISFTLHGDAGSTSPVTFVRDSATYPTLESNFVAAVNAVGLGDLNAAVVAENRFSINSAAGANIGIETFSVTDVGAITHSIDFDDTTLTEGSPVDSAFRTSIVVVELDADYSIESDVSGTAASGAFGIFDAQAGNAATIDSGILADLDTGIERILAVRASVGARLNSLDLQENLHSDFVLEMESLLSDTRDLDFAEAISRFNLQQVALQAAQQTYVRVQDLSLFNFL